jgi:hypothetical protein
MAPLVSLRGIWNAAKLSIRFLGKLQTAQGGWLKLPMREEKGGLLSPQVLSLLWDLLEVGVAKAQADKLGHMVVETDQVLPGATGEKPFLFSFLLIVPVFVTLVIIILQLSLKHFLSQGGG